MADPHGRRWDSDERRHGIGDAQAFVSAIEELAELARTADWVTEEPETHLLPHLRKRLGEAGLTLKSADPQPGGLLTVMLSSSSHRSRRELRQAVWTVLAGAVELTTYVRESATQEWIDFDVVTGIPPDTGPFATHGHTRRIRVELSSP